MLIFMVSVIKMAGGGGVAGGSGGLYLSALLSPDVPSICKYLQTAMSGIYMKVMVAEPAVPLFQSAPCQSGNR